MDISRRSLLTGGIVLIAAPAIVRVSAIMPINVPLAEAAKTWGPVDTRWVVKPQWVFKIVIDEGAGQKIVVIED